MPFDKLPQELLSAIFSHLNGDKLEELQSLRACALTCRAFFSPAQARVFHSLSLHSEARRVLTKLESTPHIRTMVKRLSLREIHGRWIQNSKVLHDILGFLSPYIVSLHIHQRRYKPEYPRFDYSSLAKLKFLEEISLREEDVKALETTRYGDNALPAFLNHFPRLRVITIEGCWLRNEIVDNISAVAAPVFQLEKLEVGCCYDAVLLEWLMPALSTLRNLHFPAPAPSISTNMAQFMINASQSLQHLEIKICRDLNDASNADLQLLMTAVRSASGLRSLTLTLYGDSPIPTVVQALLHLDAHANLQQLTIGFYQNSFRIDGNPWEELQDLLVDTRFPALRSVELRLLLIYEEVIRMPIEHFIAVVPRLAKRNMISICHGRA